MFQTTFEVGATALILIPIYSAITKRKVLGGDPVKTMGVVFGLAFAICEIVSQFHGSHAH